MSWRAERGLPDKPISLCPVCGVESKAGRKCAYHLRTEKRTEYHAAYYRANRAKLAAAARERRRVARLRAKLRPIINDLKAAVDLGRYTAGW